MRRLKQDWNEHGWKRNPTYDYDWNTGNRILVERTTICECFDLTSREAYRFKDSPNKNSFRRRDWNLYRDGRSCNRPAQERRADPIRESFGSRKRRRNIVRRKKLCCHCGYLLAILEVKDGIGYFPYGRRRECPDHRRRSSVSGDIFSP